MRRASVLALVLALLLMASAPALAAPGKPSSPPGRDRDGDREPPAPLGRFVLAQESQTVTGEHLSFNYSAEGIDAFRARDRTLFDITVTGDEDDDDGDPRRGPRAQADGPVFRVRAPNFTFSAHDNPSAVGKLQTEGTILVTFAEDVVLSPAGESAVRFRAGDLVGTLRAEDAQIRGRTVTADEEVLVFLDAPRGSFDRHRGDIGTAIARRHVGAEATINALPEDGLQQDVVSYGNVTMTTVKAEQGNLTVLIEGHGFDGRVIVLNVDGRVLGAQSADKLDILLDNVSVAAASNLTDILDPDDDGYTPEYYLVYDPAAHVFQLIVTLPHYSVHTLTVTTLLELVRPSVVVGVLAGIALLVPAGLVLFRRR